MQSYQVNLLLPENVLNALQDRAAILGVPYTVLARDLISTWLNLVEDQDHLHERLPQIPERVVGYRAALIPSGDKRDHRDGSPLRIEEM